MIVVWIDLGGRSTKSTFCSMFRRDRRDVPEAFSAASSQFPKVVLSNCAIASQVGFEIANHADNQRVGMEDACAWYSLQRGAVDAGEVGVFDGPRVGAVRAVERLAEFAPGDAAGVVVAARDGGAHLVEFERDFLVRKFRIAQHVVEDFEALGKVVLERLERGAARVAAAADADLGAHVFENFVELLAGVILAAAAAHDRGGHVADAGEFGGIVDVAGADGDAQIDDRQFVVFHEKHDHAVGQFMTRGLRRL